MTRKQHKAVKVYSNSNSL